MKTREKNQFNMKPVNKMKDKKRKGIKKPQIKPKKEKVLIVAQEIKFARLLSGNEKKTRDRVLKSFKKWLLSCFAKSHEFKEDDFVRVWKGLFYAVWMSDKPLVQEELCETIAGILDLFPPEQIRDAFLMFKAGFKVLATEWYGIDHHRMDKFLMLVRRYLRGSLRCVARCKWKTDVCKLYGEALAGKDGILSLNTPLYARNAGSMLLHVVDCYLEEIAKVSEGNIPGPSVVELLRPICSYMVGGASPSLCMAARRLLTQLLRQSDQGLEYRERTKAWERMGCPRGGPDALELASDDDEEEMTNGHAEDDEEIEGEKPLDPRAGRVDVELNCVPVPAAPLAALLKQLLATAGSKAHQRTKICLQRFEQLAANEYPLRVGDVSEADEAPRTRAKDAAGALRALEKKLLSGSDELALRGLSRKHRKRLLAKSRSGLSIMDDVPQTEITSTNGDWAVEAAEPKTDKKTNNQADKASNKENKQANKRKHTNAQTDNKRNKNGPKEATVNLKCDKKTKQNKSTEIGNNLVKLKNNQLDKKSTVSKVKKTVENGIVQNVAVKKTVDNVKNTVDKVKKTVDLDKSKESDKIDKKILNKQKSLVDILEDKKIQLKNKKNETEVKKKNQKFNKMEKKTAPNKILNGKVEKRHQEKQLCKKSFDTPKKVKFVLKNNCMQGTVDYYKSVRSSPNIPFDSSKKPSKTNLKVCSPSPINPFFKKKLRLK